MSRSMNLVRRHVSRLTRRWALGAMAETVLSDPREEVYIKRWNGHGVSLRIDGEWALTPQQARIIRTVMDERRSQ